MPWVVLGAVYYDVRCVLLSTMENSEPRYTLELLQLISCSAACGFAAARIPRVSFSLHADAGVVSETPA